MGGKGEIFSDGLAEVVGDFTNEPPVELVTFTHRVRRRPLNPAIRIGDLLWVRCFASFDGIESDLVSGALFSVSGQWPIDHVIEAFGERLAVVFANDGDDCWTRLVSGYVRLPGVVFLAERQCVAVHAG